MFSKSHKRARKFQFCNKKNTVQCKIVCKVRLHNEFHSSLKFPNNFFFRFHLFDRLFLLSDCILIIEEKFMHKWVFFLQKWNVKHHYCKYKRCESIIAVQHRLVEEFTYWSFKNVIKSRQSTNIYGAISVEKVYKCSKHSNRTKSS